MKKLTALGILITLALVGIAASSASAHTSDAANSKTASPQMGKDGGSGGGW